MPDQRFSTMWQKLKTYKPLLIFILSAGAVYFILKYLYLGYVGLADPNGHYDLSQFFGDYNLVMLITKAHSYVSAFVLGLIGYETIVSGKLLLIKGASGVRIHYACLAIELWIALIALIITYPIHVAKAYWWKLAGVLAGVGSIFLMNNVRIITIVLTNHYNNSMTHTIHDIFNYVVYVFIIVFFLGWVNYFSKRQDVGHSE